MLFKYGVCCIDGEGNGRCVEFGECVGFGYFYEVVYEMFGVLFWVDREVVEFKGEWLVFEGE